ncbi:MAG TPA: hypothetical protein VIC58_09515 [Actinomycetota bacterium]|jgi:hypothetical protein
MPLHTCAPPRGTAPKSVVVWVCPECGATWEAAAGPGIYDFDLDEAITRAEWVMVDGPARVAG